MKSYELTTFINAIANILARNSTPEEIALLAVMFTQLGDTLATLLTLLEIDENNL